MIILFLARLFYPHIGGVEKHVLEVSKRLVTKGHKVIVITEEFSNLHHSIIDVIPAKAGIQKENIRSPWIPDQVRNDKINGIEVIRMPVGHEDSFKKFRIWKNLWKIRKVIKDADIIHCHDVFFWYMPFRLLYPRKPVYTTFHGYESYPITKKAIFTRKISEKLSSGNICIGDFIKKWYGTKPPTSRPLMFLFPGTKSD
ncbi:glycosyltransferase [Patescibacteria group bacterium]|nr:glycosyltransferase [Patescibacteria group bacterium]